MKLFVISDIHGSEASLKKALKIFNDSKSDYMVILGDYLNHAPRNALPEGYHQMGVASLLNSISDKIVAIKGNCDSEIDEEILDFPLFPILIMMSGDRRFIFTHGHIYNENHLPKMSSGDVLVHGHYHIPWLFEQDGVTIASPGSISIPRGDSKAAYMIIDNGDIGIFDLESGQSILDSIRRK